MAFCIDYQLLLIPNKILRKRLNGLLATTLRCKDKVPNHILVAVANIIWMSGSRKWKIPSGGWSMNDSLDLICTGWQGAKCNSSMQDLSAGRYGPFGIKGTYSSIGKTSCRLLPRKLECATTAVKIKLSHRSEISQAPRDWITEQLIGPWKMCQ